MMTKKQLLDPEELRRLHRQAKAEEDAADVAMYDARKAELKDGDLLSPEASMELLRAASTDTSKRK